MGSHLWGHTESDTTEATEQQKQQQQSILGCRFFPFITLNISCHSLLACRVSVEKSADSLMGVPLYVICCFLRGMLRRKREAVELPSAKPRGPEER